MSRSRRQPVPGAPFAVASTLVRSHESADERRNVRFRGPRRSAAPAHRKTIVSLLRYTPLLDQFPPFFNIAPKELREFVGPIADRRQSDVLQTLDRVGPFQDGDRGVVERVDDLSRRFRRYRKAMPVAGFVARIA